jgi:hypothetical protein
MLSWSRASDSGLAQEQVSWCFGTFFRVARILAPEIPRIIIVIGISLHHTDSLPGFRLWEPSRTVQTADTESGTSVSWRLCHRDVDTSCNVFLIAYELHQPLGVRIFWSDLSWFCWFMLVRFVWIRISLKSVFFSISPCQSLGSSGVIGVVVTSCCFHLPCWVAPSEFLWF